MTECFFKFVLILVCPFSNQNILVWHTLLKLMHNAHWGETAVSSSLFKSKGSSVIENDLARRA